MKNYIISEKQARVVVNKYIKVNTKPFKILRFHFKK